MSSQKTVSEPLGPPPTPAGMSSVWGNSSSQDTPAAPIPAAAKRAKRPKHCVHWFRKGLRLHDNPSLLLGVEGATTFRCIFILDPWFAGSSNVGINKWRFLLQCLEDLDRSLCKFNSRLFVIRGQPADALPKLFKQWGTTYLTFEEDPEPFGRVRDQSIITLCKELSIHVVSKVSHTLYDLEQIIEKNGGKPPLTYHQFQNVVASMDPPPEPKCSITAEHLQGCYTPISENHNDKYGVPTLEELGFDVDSLKPAVWVGGETEAITRLEHHLERKAWVASFGRPKMTPQSLLPSQTGLSPYLRFGCLSTRLFYYQLIDLYKKIKKATPPLSLHGQLLWREFFYCAATRNPNFDKMQGNPICVQIPWDRNPEAIAKWANGQTGFPWIDAIMAQLREEGWIHHLARHAVACFLTRGDLWISWEEGMKVFEELLLDADWSVNAGMWMWLSCSSFFQQFFHCYCPVRFGRKADPNGDYIRKYLPVLKNFPSRYIHEPWNAPEAVQRSARCVIGIDYPKPMVNHGIASRINLERMKQVYAQLSRYRGSGRGAGSSLLKEQIRLLATVSGSQSSSTVCPPSKCPSSLQQKANSCSSREKQCQVEGGKTCDDPATQQISKQPRAPLLTQLHQQQFQQQQYDCSNPSNLQHNLPSHQYLHQNQLNQQQVFQKDDIDSCLMGPPKSNPKAQSTLSTFGSTKSMTSTQNHRINSNVVPKLATSSFQAEPQPLQAMSLCSSTSHVDHHQYLSLCQTQPYHTELNNQHFSGAQMPRDEQHQYHREGDDK